ncbi:MAG: DUF3108 domain-containing protein [Xanthomonadales bacterium]|nr:DUF3108 domain-containing protein [Xanthomonadales bacterium]
MAFFAVGTAAACDSPIPPAELHYRLEESDREKGTATALLQPGESGWVYTVTSEGRFGPFRVIIEESSTVTWAAEGPQPLAYQRVSRGGPFKRTSEMAFDWPALRASGTHRGDRWELPLEGGELDRLSMQLATAVRLAQGVRSINLVYIDRGRSRELSADVPAATNVETPAGTYAAFRVDRVRGDRYTSTFHAPRLHFLPVRIDHRDEDDDWSMLLVSAEFGECR